MRGKVPQAAAAPQSPGLPYKALDLSWLMNTSETTKRSRGQGGSYFPIFPEVLTGDDAPLLVRTRLSRAGLVHVSVLNLQLLVHNSFAMCDLSPVTTQHKLRGIRERANAFQALVLQTCACPTD